MGIKSLWNKLKGKRKEYPQEQQESDVDLTKAFARVYMTELWFEKMPEDLEVDRILGNLQRQLGKVRRLGGSSDADQIASKTGMHFVFDDHQYDFGESGMKASMQMVAMKASDRAIAPPDFTEEKYHLAIHQSWMFPDAKERLLKCRYSMLVTDIMSIEMESQKRIKVYQTVMYEIVKILQPDAIYWPQSQQFMDTQMYLKNVPGTSEYDILLGPLNVRMFTIGGEESTEMVMDTLGLAAIGLPDLQIHFQGMDPNNVAGILNGTGHYIFEKGDVIEDGNTVAGWEASQRWVCRHEVSLTEPRRIVVDINPGQPFVAGNR